MESQPQNHIIGLTLIPYRSSTSQISLSGSISHASSPFFLFISIGPDYGTFYA